MTRILHFADLHLDSVFAWAGEAANIRRENLRETLRNIAHLAQDLNCDALLSGGDLYEHERVTPDTAEFLRATFAALDPMPVFLAPGNHDWYGPDSLYVSVDWSPNVHVFREPRFTSVPLADGLTLWGAAHQAPANTDNFLDGFCVRGRGTHIGLFHGAEKSWLTQQGEGKAPHAPFDAADIEMAGFAHAFLGHYHRPRDAARHTYPGNPRSARIRRRRSARRGDRHHWSGREHHLRGAARSQLPRRRISCSNSLAVRVGRTPAIDSLTRPRVRRALRESPLRERWPRVWTSANPDLIQSLDCFQAVQVRRGQIHAAYDIETLGKELTVRGQFVRDVTSAGLSSDEERRVLMTGPAGRLRDGEDLEVL